MKLIDYPSPADHPGAVYLHGLDVWAVRVGGRAAAVKSASARGWTAFRWLGDWFVSDQKPNQQGARELVGRMVPKSNPPKLNAAFWKWFGKSKVVDKQGRPLVVYHGTKAKLFSVFDIGFAVEGGIFFTDHKCEARMFARIGTGREAQRIESAYLSLRNPLVLDVEGQHYDEYMMREILDMAAREKRDGVIIQNIVNFDGSPESTTYIAFHPAQIKSATSNRGTWDPKDPDIRHNPEPSMKRSADFAQTGTYEVIINGKLWRIYRDPESRAWLWADAPENPYVGLRGFLGWTKAEALERLKSRS